MNEHLLFRPQGKPGRWQKLEPICLVGNREVILDNAWFPSTEDIGQDISEFSVRWFAMHIPDFC